MLTRLVAWRLAGPANAVRAPALSPESPIPVAASRFRSGRRAFIFVSAQLCSFLSSTFVAAGATAAVAHCFEHRVVRLFSVHLPVA